MLPFVVCCCCQCRVVTLPGRVVTLPGTVVTLHGRVVTLPGRVVTLPGTVMALPGTVMALPGRVAQQHSVHGHPHSPVSLTVRSCRSGWTLHFGTALGCL